MNFRRSLAKLLLILVALAGTAQAQVRTEVVTYPSGEKQVTVEVFSPSTKGKHPAVILLHGSGGLEQATGGVFRRMASNLAAKGYVALIPHYFEKTDHVLGARLKDGEYEAMLQAVSDAVEYAAGRAEVDPERFAAIGFSMGSGLAMTRAIRDPRIKAVASVSGAYPPIQPNKKLPPLLILHGSKDTSTPLEYVKKYAEALKAFEMPHDLHIYNGVGHNFDVGRFDDVTKRSVAFFDKYVKAPRR